MIDMATREYLERHAPEKVLTDIHAEIERITDRHDDLQDQCDQLIIENKRLVSWARRAAEVLREMIALAGGEDALLHDHEQDAHALLKELEG